MSSASLALLAAACSGRAAPAPAPPRPESRASRTFEFVYEAQVAAVPPDRGPVDVFVPLAQTDEHQDVLEREIDSTVPGRVGREAAHGNLFWHTHMDRGTGAPIRVAVRYRVRRYEHTNPPRGSPGALSGADRARLEPWLRATPREPTRDPLLDRIGAEIAPGERDLARVARAIYDWIVDHVEYKKTGTGWGHGDIHWACTERYGNCTDFHALFVSLARARGIPARFEMGVPVPADRPEGEVAGYHCWVQFWLPGSGWIPIDASEAKKHPERREDFYGAHPADRLGFTVGRDLVLGDGHRGAPLNYFIYPHVEVGGEALETTERRFAYRDVVAPAG